MAVQTLKIDLLGASFTIQTDESREYVQEILAYIRKRSDEVQRTARVGDPLKTSILASVYIVDELFRERAKMSSRDSDTEEAGRRTNQLIDRLDRSLKSLSEDADAALDDAEESAP